MQEVVPVKKKISYRTVSVQSVVAAKLRERLPGDRCIVPIDVAKADMVAGFAGERGDCKGGFVRFSHPKQTLLFVTLLVVLRELGLRIEVAMEPTGTYGEALRCQLVERGFPVFRVDPVRSHAIAAVLDGVPSQHDAKSCTLIGHLHGQGISSPWREKTDEERAMRALVDERATYQDPLERNQGRLEAKVAEYFPELGEELSSKCAWHLHLLAHFPSPARIVAAPKEVEELLRGVTRKQFSLERIEGIVQLARNSTGKAMTAEEEHAVSALVTRMLQDREQLAEVDKRIGARVRHRPELASLVTTFGAVTTAAFIADLGDPAQYDSAASLEKAMGLNLKEKSSGKFKGQLRITKRGSPRVRKYLYLAAMRLIKTDPIVRAWYQARSAYAAHLKLKAIVAVMRKLARAMVHLAKGARFDASKLFDVRRLKLAEQAARAPSGTREGAGEERGAPRTPSGVHEHPTEELGSSI